MYLLQDSPLPGTNPLVLILLTCCNYLFFFSSFKYLSNFKYLFSFKYFGVHFPGISIVLLVFLCVSLIFVVFLHGIVRSEGLGVPGVARELVRDFTDRKPGIVVIGGQQ